jgi:hypothetical protein
VVGGIAILQHCNVTRSSPSKLNSGILHGGVAAPSVTRQTPRDRPIKAEGV